MQLYYIDLEGNLMSVNVAAGDVFNCRRPQGSLPRSNRAADARSAPTTRWQAFLISCPGSGGRGLL